MARIIFYFLTCMLFVGCMNVNNPEQWPPTTPGKNEWRDRTTGHKVIRLSRREGTNEVFYFYKNPFTALGDKMVFMGLTDEGRCPFTVDMTTFEIRQLASHNAGFEVVAPKSRLLFYLSGESVYATHLDTLDTRKVADVPPHYCWGRGFSINSEETLLAGCYCLGEEKFYASDKPRKQWIHEIWEARLPNALYTIDIQSGEIKEIYHKNEWLGHVQFSPADPALIMFCHEGPGRKLDRMWLIRSDGADLRKLHNKQYPSELQTHEFWSPDGAHVWCDFQMPSLPERMASFMEILTYPRFFLASIHVNTLELTKYPIKMRHASRHFNISPDQTMFCGDGEGGSFRLCPSGKWIFLYKFDKGRLKVQRLCSMAGHSWKTYPEPNSHFTPNGKWVVFQSDVEGTTQVYAVEVERSPDV